MSSSHIRVFHDSVPADDPTRNIHVWTPAPAPILVRSGIFNTPIPISDELCDFFELPRGSELSRSDVTRRVCSYAKTNGLMNGQRINADELLRGLLKLKPEDQLNILNLQRFLKPHYELNRVKAFEDWFESRGFPLIVDIAAKTLSKKDFQHLYQSLVRKPEHRFVIYTDCPVSDDDTMFEARLRDEDEDGSSEDEGHGGLAARPCGCYEVYRIKCSYHTYA